MRVPLVGRGVAGVCLAVVLGATSGCGSATSGGSDPGGGGPAPGGKAPAATAGYESSDEGFGSGGGTDGTSAANNGDPGVPGIQPPPDDPGGANEFSAGVDGSIGGFDYPSYSSCPTPGPTDYPDCLDTSVPSPTGPAVIDPTVADSQQPVEDTPGPTDGLVPSPEPS